MNQVLSRFFSLFCILFILAFLRHAKAQSIDHDSYVQKLLNLETNYDPTKEIGPNCWNLALHSLGWEPVLLFTDSSQIEDVLTSPYCQQINVSEIKKSDIGVIKTEYDTHLHAFMVLNPQMGLTKDLGSADSSYKFYHKESIQQIFNSYYKDPASDYCAQNADAEQSPCGSVLSFYRCGQAPILPTTSMTLWLSSLEQIIQKYYVTQTNLQKDELKNFVTAFQNFKTEEIQIASVSDKEKLFLRTRIRAILDFANSYSLGLSLQANTLALKKLNL